MAQVMPPIDPAFVRVPIGSYIAIMTDDGNPVGVKAVGQGCTVDVMFDRVQLKSFAKQILRALQR